MARTKHTPISSRSSRRAAAISSAPVSIAAAGVAQAEAQSDRGFAAQCRIGARPGSSCPPMTRRRRCAGWSRSPTCCKRPGIGEPGAIAVHPRSDRGLGRHRPARPRRRPAGLAAGRRAAARSPLGADHRRPRRSRPAARAARPGRRCYRRRGGYPRSTRTRAAVRTRPLPARPGHRAAQSPAPPRRRRHPRRSRRHLRHPGRPAVAGAGRRPSAPASRPDPTTRSPPPSGASPTWSPPGKATPRSPPPCTSASRPSRPTSPASTANSASAAASTSREATPAKPGARRHPAQGPSGGLPWRGQLTGEIRRAPGHHAADRPTSRAAGTRRNTTRFEYWDSAN